MSINKVAMALMPTSQAVAWYLVMIHNNSSDKQQLGTRFYPSISSIAAFYCAWALYNRYLGGNVQELGQYTMGLLSIATYFQSFIGSVVATGLVLFNFLLVSYFILIKWNSEELARNVKNDTSSLATVWANVFKTYFVSNICLWSVVLYKFCTYRTM